MRETTKDILIPLIYVVIPAIIFAIVVGYIFSRGESPLRQLCDSTCSPATAISCSSETVICEFSDGTLVGKKLYK